MSEHHNIRDFIDAIDCIRKWLDQNSFKSKVRITIEFSDDIDKDHAEYLFRNTRRVLFEYSILKSFRHMDKVLQEATPMPTRVAFEVHGIPIKFKSPLDNPQDIEELLREIISGEHTP